ncbi:hypothetical protein NEPAR06_1209 [Nematocida parisii]|uniref:Uncharacterized protein n=1 Tax=Nematocida parisii (strain ERTm3) TaxID=935791 RepID=I3EK41_NEMP3|nr:uncharacterized protein NEPG_00877 [Nematocida parisii ERTm1]EIJ89588.1 hypothetical protein NEQG_00358 [Nematocida parisii ERTm3]KAI5128620.1 hypothetical protein NEPAR08_1331 [Nematocida parisii]EIJ94210.1 hypothetical protein NEPG_00877 [Nematocida parisii ERTm1]KAI5128956.1 hypothetical protein NEPAR03_1447 [Nematocida parisii]KAI5141490.1 hypothetical protein NEPAR04_0991 [Nematocida parisii]|eukprot:XP_013058706.1 hypothetical protein NEPG_00877 [Nematocida parisii ERTm1]
MTPFQIFIAARRSNDKKILHLREDTASVLIGIPLSAIIRLIVKCALIDYSAAGALLIILYIAYIIFLRASNVIAEYDTDSACRIAIYFILSKWSILGMITLYTYSPYSLVFILNMIIPDELYVYTMMLLLMGYSSLFAISIDSHINTIGLYPAVILALSLAHFILLFQEEPFKKTKRLFILGINSVNILFFGYLVFYWSFFICSYEYKRKLAFFA